MIRKLVREFARQSPKEPMPQRHRQSGLHESGPRDLPQSDGNTSRHNLEDKVFAFIRSNTSGVAPMDIGNIGTLQAKGWEQQGPAGMNNLERDSKQYDVLVMEIVDSGEYYERQ